MTKSTVFGVSLAIALGVGGVAQTQSSLRAPAEVPPPGYTGSQYVDSTGCVYVRAGTSGAVTWVPRVTRDRQPICGFEPSLPTAATASARAPAQPVLVQAKPAPILDPVVVPSASAAGGNRVTPLATPSSQTRFIPEHLIPERRALSTVETPKGFRPAWMDGRLNPRRAEQTLEGQAQTRQIWTDTVPRRLVD